MAVDLPEINRPACTTARAEHVKPGRPCDQRGPDRRRPQHVPGKLLIPALDDGFRLGAPGLYNRSLRTGLAVISPRATNPELPIAKSIRAAEATVNSWYQQETLAA
jgi:hypothetical protein